MNPIRLTDFFLIYLNEKLFCDLFYRDDFNTMNLAGNLIF